MFFVLELKFCPKRPHSFKRKKKERKKTQVCPNTETCVAEIYFPSSNIFYFYKLPLASFTIGLSRRFN
ncbi:hypothetical protein AQUCO_07300011v1 [Aquilegia coerulea]|uniref:Uncharacterized protein n=1 Tax=Aquilegia coerulea TaxID=218851 RepID=A0A2G5C9R3_AQUCA|nr:hypothetical protein AQUCO_07300011v1 [Aquilegia coerulea]